MSCQCASLPDSKNHTFFNSFLHGLLTFMVFHFTHVSTPLFVLSCKLNGTRPRIHMFCFYLTDLSQVRPIKLIFTTVLAKLLFREKTCINSAKYIRFFHNAQKHAKPLIYSFRLCLILSGLS